MPGDVVPGEGTMTDTPPDIGPPPPNDLVKPEGYLVQDRINDMGGAIAITWPGVAVCELRRRTRGAPVARMSIAMLASPTVMRASPGATSRGTAQRILES